jgi:transposase
MIMRQIYGIDLAKEKFDVNFLGLNGEEKSVVVDNRFQAIVNFLERVPDNAILCCEYTGVYGELLCHLAITMGKTIARATGYEIKHSMGLQKGKTDKIDARRIREYAERFYDKLRFAQALSPELKELRKLYNLRAKLVKCRKMLLTSETGNKCADFQSLKAVQVANDVIENYNQAIETLESEMVEIIKSNKELLKNYKQVISVKGIGQVTACELIVKTENFKKIDSARKAASFAGICPFPNESGKMVKKSRVSKMSDKQLKTLLFMCSKIAVRSNPEYKLYFLRKKQEGKPYYLIMNNVANKLLRTVFHLVKTEREYILGHITEEPRKQKKVA